MTSNFPWSLALQSVTSQIGNLGLALEYTSACFTNSSAIVECPTQSCRRSMTCMRNWDRCAPGEGHGWHNCPCEILSTLIQITSVTNKLFTILNLWTTGAPQAAHANTNSHHCILLEGNERQRHRHVKLKMCNFSVSTECKETWVTGSGMGKWGWCCIRRRLRVTWLHMWDISSPTPIITTMKYETFTTFRPKLWTKEHHNLHGEKRIYIVASFLKEIKRQ